MTLAFLSGILAFIFYLDVYRDALKGKIKPNPTSWFIWSLNDSLILAASWSAGAVNTLAVPFIYAIFGWAILAVTYRNAISKPNTLEKLCLLGSIFSWLLYIINKDAFYSLLIGVLVNALGCLPTIKGLWKDPNKESLRSWSLLLVASFFSLFSLEQYKVELLLFPVSSLILIAIINLLIIRKFIISF